MAKSLKHLKKSFPVEITNKTLHSTQLINLPQYIIITNDRNYYTTLTSEQISTCESSNPKHCNFVPLFKSLKTIECTFHIFNNDKPNIKSSCDFKVFPNSISPHIEQITDDSVLIYRLETLNLKCNSQNTTVPGCSFCVFKIPCHCILLSNPSNFTSKIALCEEKINDFTKLHPVNLAILQHFFDDKKLSNILANTTFTNPITVSLPEFNIYKNKMNHIFAKDENYHLSLNKLVQRVKNQNIIYSTLADSMVDGHTDLDFQQWPTTNDILSLVSIIITSINTVVLIWLFYKFKITATAIALYQPVQTSATTIPNFEFESPTTTTSSSWINVLNSNLKWDHGIFAFSFLSFLLIIVLIFKSIKRSNMHTKLCLKITTGFQCICIPIISMPLCPIFWDIQYPIDNLSVVNYLKPKLHVFYPKFIIRNTNTLQSIVIPDTIKLNVFQACALRSMLKPPFSAYII